MEQDNLHSLWEDRAELRKFRTAVSLHGHTQHSWESLRWLAGLRSQWPVLPFFIALARAQHRRFTGQRLDLSRTYCIPPLDPRQALRLETRQIHELGLPALVSLSDHDDAEAGLELERSASTAVSLEWTVPFGPTFFHLGVHNLPPEGARTIARMLAGYTARPSERRLTELLASLTELQQVLVVLNHPLWDEASIGRPAHFEALESFRLTCTRWIHALELNGLRSWAENRETLELARAWQKPVISGGDRHGQEPNAILNLTNARSFAEFAAEIRRDRLSHVLILPQYREPLRLRCLQTVVDVFRTYPPEHGPRRFWTERFFYDDVDGNRRPVSELWQGGRSGFLEPLLAFLRASEWQWLRPALRLMLADGAQAGAA
ncbi:MAG: hypothetical protein ABSD27_15540 [Bryobacteraceae bacterium]|jgi:hypothetical protein